MHKHNKFYLHEISEDVIKVLPAGSLKRLKLKWRH